jgi:hypothetical protein
MQVVRRGGELPRMVLTLPAPGRKSQHGGRLEGSWHHNRPLWRRTGPAARPADSLPSVMPFQAGATSVVQNAHRDAAIGIALRHCGQSRVVNSTSGPVRRRSMR